MPFKPYDPDAVMRDYYARVPLSEITQKYGICIKTIYNIRDRRLDQETRRWGHQCTHCPKRFGSHSALAAHVTKIHRELPPVCARCGDLLTDENWYPSWRGRAVKIRICRHCENARHAAKTRHERTMMIEAYGGKCVCCGETIPEFLTIDHINNNGADHRRKIRPRRPEIGGGSGVDFYRWLRQHGYPQEEYQLLCYNCNCAKGYFGQCPHKSDLRKS